MEKNENSPKVKYKRVDEKVAHPIKIARANNRCILHPYKTGTVSLGISVNVPEGYELRIRGFDKLASEKGIMIPSGTVAFGPGNTEELTVLLRNFRPFTSIIEIGDVIGEFFLTKMPELVWEERG